jgi:hypothetical protein
VIAGTVVEIRDRTRREREVSCYSLVMSRRGAVWLAALLFLGNAAGAAAAGDPTAGEGGSQEESGLARALEAARDVPGGPFHLLVNCAGEQGFRGLEVFPSGVAVWNGRSQVELATAVRVALLETLIRRDFPSLEASYGGREEPGSPTAALRIICRVELDINGRHKSSVQLADGEQSPELSALAGELLDLVAPLAATGISAENLSDGLAKVALATLAPESFELRFVQLPEAGGEGAGSILRVEGGVISIQPYAPGRAIGEPVSLDLEPADFAAFVSAIRRADPETLPVNLWSEFYLEFEVRVLQHRRSIMARPFSRLSGQKGGEPQQRFDRLVAALREIETSRGR